MKWIFTLLSINKVEGTFLEDGCEDQGDWEGVLVLLGLPLIGLLLAADLL